MPEGPEIHQFARFINHHAAGKKFSRVFVSALTKYAAPALSTSAPFAVSATARGKEIMISMAGKTFLLLQPGMSGSFKWTDAANANRSDDERLLTDVLPKHSHLNFLAPAGVLSFVDPRRFGRWQEMASATEWSAHRSPCVISEARLWREYLTEREAQLQKKTASIAVVLLDQSLFNGIGNYLRAEILFDAGIGPFTSTASVFSNENARSRLLDSVERVSQMFFQAKHALIWHTGNDPADQEIYNKSRQDFVDLLNVYTKGSSDKDGGGRTIWWSGSRSGLNVSDSSSSKKKASGKKQDKIAKPKAKPKAAKPKAVKPKKRAMTRAAAAAAAAKPKAKPKAALTKKGTSKKSKVKK